MGNRLIRPRGEVRALREILKGRAVPVTTIYPLPRGWGQRKNWINESTTSPTASEQHNVEQFFYTNPPAGWSDSRTVDVDVSQSELNRQIWERITRGKSAGSTSGSSTPPAGSIPGVAGAGKAGGGFIFRT